jgi:flagellar protein FliO/FliZ
MTIQAALLVSAALIGVIMLIGGAAKLVRAGGWRLQPATGRTLCVKESIALDQRRRIHLVQCGQRQVVVLTGGAQDLVIGWMPES